jgi:hypothetical protein
MGWSLPCCTLLGCLFSHVGADVDGLACCPHQPMECDGQARVHSLLTGVVPSHHTVWIGVALDHLFEGGGEAPVLGCLA